MAALLFLAPLLLLSTVAGQFNPGIEGCHQLGNATRGNFSVGISPQTYLANTTYEVTIKDDRNHSNSAGYYLLQALSPQNTSVGQWKAAPTGNCSSFDTAILDITKNTTNWISPDSNLSSVQFRVYFSLSDNAIELKTLMLNREAESSTPPTPSSVCRAQSSSFFLAALQLPLLLLTGTLLS